MNKKVDIEYEIKKVIVGHLMDLMCYAWKESQRFSDFGVNIQAFGEMEDKLWKSIKFVVGMPEIEELGVWVSDYWLEVFAEYVNAEIPKDKAMQTIINWRNQDFDNTK
ncbi:hypothetical protein DRW41_17170 [Neobacillus piezotolerans]|uniref:Uncharacterized protein n=1 Tax=Neobacillus piezotolerans TaxID=2259171 RepID=A0A3D8GM84_9BACI|nr:hypothetical protein [Neobacillus piezotolerans]RDU35471.1 hypothetical protein DRW41_17170 [Neobacillus piezotolerans]